MSRREAETFISPAREPSSLTATCPGLRDRGTQGLADVAECRVDGAGQLAHAGSRTESDESDDQSVLDQILTFFAAGQILKLHIELQKHVVHFDFLHCC